MFLVFPADTKKIKNNTPPHTHTKQGEWTQTQLLTWHQAQVPHQSKEESLSLDQPNYH